MTAPLQHQTPDTALLTLIRTAPPQDPARDAAFHELVRRHAPWMHAFARRQLPIPSDVDDAVQAVLILLIRRAPRMHRDIRLTGWLFETLRYTLRTITRARRRRQRHERAAPPVQPAPPARDDRLASLDAAIQSLRPPDRRILLLRYYRDFSFPEIAAALRTSEPAARQRTSRALRRLRNRLGLADTAPLTAVPAIAAPALLQLLAAPALTILRGGTPSASLATLFHATENAMLTAKLTAASLLSAAVIGSVSIAAAVHYIAAPPTALSLATAPAADSILVLTPDGKPAPNARLYIVNSSQGINIVNGRVPDAYTRTVTTLATTVDGRATLPPVDPADQLFILEDAGFAQVALPAAHMAGQITLTAWAHVDGQALRETRPAADIAVSLEYENDINGGGPIRIGRYSVIKADAQGKFSFDRVFADNLRVSAVQYQPMSNGVSLAVPIATVHLSPAAGQSANIKLGGAGRQVTGRVILPDSIKNIPHDLPALALSPVDKNDHNAYYLFVNDDGTFRGDNIPAGPYTFSGRAEESNRPGLTVVNWGGDTVATGEKQISLPEIPNGVSDTPLDIGSFTLTAATLLPIGAPAPDFTAKNFDGSDISLAALRGKYVILDFWSSGCKPCLDSLPADIDAAKNLASDDRVVIIGLNVDTHRDAAAAFIASHNITWTQAWLGPITGTEPVSAAYHVTGVPSVWLINPEGNVALKAPSLNSAAAELAATLKHNDQRR